MCGIFGSGIVAGDTGIVLQNRGSSFSLDPAHSNHLEPGQGQSYIWLTSAVLTRRSLSSAATLRVSFNSRSGSRVVELLFDYRVRRHGRPHSARADKMTEKSAVTPIASSVQMKKKPPLRLVPKPIPTPRI